jgi:hypothetical protein
MRDINSLTLPSLDNSWAVNNSMVQELQSAHEVTEQVLNILDVNYEKEDLQSVVITN